MFNLTFTFTLITFRLVLIFTPYRMADTTMVSTTRSLIHHHQPTYLLW